MAAYICAPGFWKFYLLLHSGIASLVTLLFLDLCQVKISKKKLEKAMFKAFAKDGELPIYDPERFFDFCKNASADNVFNFILSSIFSDRHSKDRKELNKKHTVALLYQLCFGLSQRCDSLQKDSGFFPEILPLD